MGALLGPLTSLLGAGGAGADTAATAATGASDVATTAANAAIAKKFQEQMGLIQTESEMDAAATKEILAMYQNITQSIG